MKNKITLALQGLVAIFTLALIFSCGSGRNINADENENLQKLVQSRHFEIENDWAAPLRGSQINLIGNTNYIRFVNDSVMVYLPYFGVRYSGGGYNSEGGFKFEGIPENLQFGKDKKDNTVITFETDQGSENLDFRITLYGNKNAVTNVNSSDRDAISYRGDVHEWKEQE
ncbi:DUF4251 domain-containing protein [Christiangramia fulva]|nr:DUF4251 domain-containing protein [Christiangramia fulva]